MSVQFGKWNFDGKPVNPDEVNRVSSLLAPYAPDDARVYTCSGMQILHLAFYTTKESRLESQPLVTSCGDVLTWDGRLDNRAELLDELKHKAGADLADVALVAMAYDRWCSECLPKIIGDWALSIWNPRERSLLLARDFVGIRPLYYSLGNHHVTWSTVLDPLVRFAGKPLTLNPEYVSGWLSFFPAADVTPYREIHSVPPSSSVRIRAGSLCVHKYWEIAPAPQTRYRSDSEYEEHFRAVFSQAVRRRLRSDRPILAELSGGMDSSSIVCMADDIIKAGNQDYPALQTVSYFNDFEPHWNERPYFTKVEERRGRAGCHIDIGRQEPLTHQFDHATFATTPAAGARPTKFSKQFADCLLRGNIRVVLSGVGGDEVMGGVPNPLPELQDLLVLGRFRHFLQQLKLWALAKNKPCLQIFCEVCLPFLPALSPVPQHKRPASWVNPEFLQRNRIALRSSTPRVRLFGPPPSFQNSLSTLDGLRRQIACTTLPSRPGFEKRYPFLDRNLLQFLCAIPREQLVRPGQRRSLMRRALTGIVPDELIHRKRKAYTSCSPLRAIHEDWVSLLDLSQRMITDSLGIVNAGSFSKALKQARLGLEVPIIPLMRTLTLEYWIRTAHNHGIFDVSRGFDDCEETALEPRSSHFLAG